jgi:hypothetical protein
VAGTSTPTSAFNVTFDTPLLFKEKSTFHVELHGVHMQGKSGVLFQGNEVYVYGISADVRP